MEDVPGLDPPPPPDLRLIKTFRVGGLIFFRNRKESTIDLQVAVKK